MKYTLEPDQLRDLAAEIHDDLSNTYEAMRDEGISLARLKELERRRELLLHQRESALVLAQRLDAVNELSSLDRNIELLGEIFNKASA